MGINELVAVKRGKVAVIEEQEKKLPQITNVKYALVDASKYSFEYKVNDDIDVTMFESDRVYDCDELIDADFDSSISEVDYSYYKIAVASGLLTGFFSPLKLSPDAISKINEWKNKDWDKYITIAAQIAGYAKKDANGAYSFLKDRIVPFVGDALKSEVQAGLDSCLNRLSSHPTAAGLVFSVFTQFSEENYSFGDKGLIKEPVPKYYAIGRNVEEKLIYAFLYWVFNFGMDSLASQRNIIDDLKMPKEVINLLKDIYKLPLFKDFPHSYLEAEEKYSLWIKRVFEDSNYKDINGHKQDFDLKKEIGEIANDSIPGSLPVIINECIVRGFYLLKKLVTECKEKNISSFSDLNKINVDQILPFNNRLISRMTLISSGCFMGVNIAGVTAKAISGAKKGRGEFRKTLLTEINVAGVGRFVFAVIADSQYWGEDIEIILQRRNKNRNVDEKAEERKTAEDMIDNDALNVLKFTPEQTQALYSMENLIVLKDIEHTTSSKEKEKKQKWLEAWQNRLIDGLEIDLPNYFVLDEKKIYEVFNSMEESEENLRWFYLMAMELVLFKPYSPLGMKEDAEFKKLKCDKYNYVDDQFIRRQTIISQAEIDAIRDSYKKYTNYLKGTTKNAAIAASVTAVAAVATGGLAFAFAPEIAAVIAGEAVAGLHGAALTSASLAFVGGGSIASGGLGMAGGAAIITGGGSLLGVAGSGTASMAAILTQTTSEYWIRQTTKLLVFCKNVLHDRLNLDNAINNLSKELKITIKKVEDNLAELEQENCSLDKDVIKASKECLKYLNKCKSELDKIAKTSIVRDK